MFGQIPDIKRSAGPYRPIIQRIPRVYHQNLPRNPYVYGPGLDITLWNNNGSIEINPLKTQTNPYWLLPDDGVVSIPAGQITPTPRIPFTIDSKLALEVVYLMIEAENFNFTIELYDAKGRHLLMNRAVLADTISGSAQRPYVWIVPWFLDPAQVGNIIYARFQNLDPTTPLNIHPAFACRAFHEYESPPEQVEVWDDYRDIVPFQGPFFYTTDEPLDFDVDATPEGLRSAQIRIGDRASFVAQKVNARTFPVPAAQPSYRIREKNFQRTLSNGFVLENQFAGVGGFPLNYPDSMFLEKNFKWEIEAIGTEVGGEHFITFGGYNIKHLSEWPKFESLR